MENHYLKPLQIGRLKTTHNILLAPLAGISNLAFRRLCREFGADLTFTEMVSVDGLIFGNQNTRNLLDFESGDRPVGIQIFGSEPEQFKRAISRLVSYTPDVIDLNFGCPVRKVVAKGAGAAILKDFKKFRNIVEVMKEHSPFPVSVKIRTGWDKKSVVATDAALVAESAGADAVTVHGRTRDQGYSGTADWETIASVKAAVHIPVIGNGDVFDAESALKMFKTTGVDGIMLARGVLGKPWLFRQIISHLYSGRPYPEIEPAERLAVLEQHYRLEMNKTPARLVLSKMKKHVVWYTKGLPHSAQLRDQIFRAQHFEEIRGLLKKYFKNPDSPHQKITQMNERIELS